MSEGINSGCRRKSESAMSEYIVCCHKLVNELDKLFNINYNQTYIIKKNCELIIFKLSSLIFKI